MLRVWFFVFIIVGILLGVFGLGFWLSTNKFGAQRVAEKSVLTVSDVSGVNFSLADSSELNKSLLEWGFWDKGISYPGNKGEFIMSAPKVLRVHFTQSSQTNNQVFRKPPMDGVNVQPFLSTGYALGKDNILEIFVQVRVESGEITKYESSLDALVLTQLYQLTHSEAYRDNKKYSAIYAQLEGKVNIFDIKYE